MKPAFILAAAVAASMVAPAHAATASDVQAIIDARTAGAPGIGIVVGVIDHGRQRAYISGSSGTARPLDGQTLFEIGSDTKTFTNPSTENAPMQMPIWRPACC